MLDASILPLEENMAISQTYLKKCAENEIILEVEAGVVGGEEDGAAGSEDTPDEDLYTTPEDMVAVHEALAELGRLLLLQLLETFMVITNQEPLNLNKKFSSCCGPRKIW